MWSIKSEKKENKGHVWSFPHDGHAWCISFSSATRGTWFSTVRPHVAHAPGCGGSACGVRPHVAYACGRRAARAFEATRGACFRVSASRGRVDIPDHTWSLFLELRPHVVSYPRARPRVVLCFLRPRVDVPNQPAEGEAPGRGEPPAGESPRQGKAPGRAGPGRSLGI